MYQRPSGLRRRTQPSCIGENTGEPRPVSPADHLVGGGGLDTGNGAWATTRVLLEMLASVQAPFTAFVAACACFKELHSGSHFTRGHDQCVRAIQIELSRPILHDGVQQLLKECSSQSRALPSTKDLAIRWGTSDRDVSQAIQQHLGIGIARLRIAARCRPAIHLIITTPEAVSQIAYRCEYEHPSQLDHDLQRMLGVCPRELRQQAIR